MYNHSVPSYTFNYIHPHPTVFSITFRSLSDVSYSDECRTKNILPVLVILIRSWFIGKNSTDKRLKKVQYLISESQES